MTYSVAIRTLGTSKDTLFRELKSLHSQTVPPESIIIYIAKGYLRPDFQVGMEEYVEVNKGMVAQRALDYNEISSDCILMLDDDVELQPSSVEILLKQLESNDADCVAADTFQNHNMSFLSKIKAFMVNFVHPRFNDRWAFKLNSYGSFSYINNPTPKAYPSQSAAGPASLWRKDSFLRLDMKDELWLDRLKFAFGEDEVVFYKLFRNGGKLMVSFNSGIVNLDGKSSSSIFQEDPRKFYLRSKANVIRWHRIHYNSYDVSMKAWHSMQYALRLTWLGMIHIGLSLVQINPKIATGYFKGIMDGFKFIKSSYYRALPDYVLSKQR